MGNHEHHKHKEMDHSKMDHSKMKHKKEDHSKMNHGNGDHSEMEPIAAFSENEGLTLVVPKSKADSHGLGYGSAFKCITLKIHSSLEAVGLTAAISTKLTEYNVSANVIAGYYHDF